MLPWRRGFAVSGHVELAAPHPLLSRWEATAARSDLVRSHFHALFISDPTLQFSLLPFVITFLFRWRAICLRSASEFPSALSHAANEREPSFETFACIYT